MKIFFKYNISNFFLLNVLSNNNIKDNFLMNNIEPKKKSK